ncbi:MAG TPA: C39 family peptidase [Candidatus Nanoarchaeia archaeon]|nr:C39 family peptidase [Candidatus Nanoarchaeia archaeon]
MNVPYHKQQKFNTCGPAALRMALEALGIMKSEQELAKILKTNIFQGTLHKNLIKAAWLYDLRYVSFSNASIKDLKDFQAKGYVIIVSYRPPEDFYHYAVLKAVDDKYIYLYDPWYGPFTRWRQDDFLNRWKSNPLFEKKKRWIIAMKK